MNKAVNYLKRRMNIKAVEYWEEKKANTSKLINAGKFRFLNLIRKRKLNEGLKKKKAAPSKRTFLFFNVRKKKLMNLKIN